MVMAETEVKQAEKLNGCPALKLCVHGWSELIKAGLVPSDSVVLNWDDSVLWVEDSGQIVGVMTYKVMEWTKCLWVGLSFVNPEYRRQGLYSQMYARAVEIAKEKAMIRVESGIDPQNVAMIQAAKKTGRHLHYVVYAQNV